MQARQEAAADLRQIHTYPPGKALESLGVNWGAANKKLSPATRLQRALLVLLTVGRERPHLYGLMFSTPSTDPEEALAAVGASQEVFLKIVAAVVGERDARRYGALLLSTAQGIATMELNGHLAQEKWAVTGEELVSMLVRSIQASAN